MPNDYHKYLVCSACDATLVDIWVVKPDLINPLTGKPFVWRMQANCPFCGDQSYITEVVGKYFPGGYAVSLDDEHENEIPSTILENINYNEADDLVTFTVMKANPHAKPCKCPLD